MPSINPQQAPLYPMMQMSPAVSYSTPEAYARLDQILADMGLGLTNALTLGSAGHVRVLQNDNASAISQCQCVYISAADACDLAKADAVATTAAIGFVVDNVIRADAFGKVICDGTFTASTGAWDVVTGQVGGLTSGSIYYLSQTTAGNITTTAPSTLGQFVKEVGTAISTTEMLVGPQRRIKL